MAAPYVNIELDEKRKLRYRHNEMADMEQLTGKDVGQLLYSQKFHGLRVMLAFGLRWMEPKITPTKAGDLIQDHWIAKGKTLEDLVDVLEAALIAGGLMQAKKPKPEDDEGNEQPEAETT